MLNFTANFWIFQKNFALPSIDSPKIKKKKSWTNYVFLLVRLVKQISQQKDDTFKIKLKSKVCHVI